MTTLLKQFYFKKGLHVFLIVFVSFRWVSLGIKLRLSHAQISLLAEVSHDLPHRERPLLAGNAQMVLF